MSDKKIAFLGTGSMGVTIIKSILKNRLFKPEHVIATHHCGKRVDELKTMLPIKVINSNSEATKEADIIVLCVRPQQLENLLREITHNITHEKLIISIAVGVSIDALKKNLINKPAVIRVIPSSLAFTMQKIGVSFIIYKKETEKKKVEVTKKIFSSIGEVKAIEEKDINNYIVLSSCTPAFFSTFINAFTEIATEMGMDPAESCELGASVCYSVGKIILEEKISPKEIIERIATPNGVTWEGLKILNTVEFKNLLKETFLNSFRRVTSFEKLFE